MRKPLKIIFAVLLVSLFLSVNAQKKGGGRNPFGRELSDIAELEERIGRQKNESQKKKNQERLKLAKDALAAVLKRELAVLEKEKEGEERKMAPYKKNIEKIEAEMKRLKQLAGEKEASAKDGADEEPDDGIVEGKAGKKAEKKSVKKEKKRKKSKKKSDSGED